MPGLTHEAIVELVRRAPELVLSILWPDGPPAGCAVVHVTAGEVVDLKFAERRADVVLALGGTANRPESVAVIEIQLQIDPEKYESWPVYITGMRSRYRCPVGLIVIALDRKVARWCAGPIDLGYGCCVVRPRVLGPDDIPVITDPERARALPELAVLSVAAHADEPVALEVALAAVDAARELDDGRQILYHDLVFGLLGPRARTLLEKLMSTAQRQFYSDIFQEKFDEGIAKGKAEGKAEGEAEGIAKGKAELLLKQLALKQFAVSEADRQRILDCTDPELLDTWACRVLTATSLSEVFAAD